MKKTILIFSVLLLFPLVSFADYNVNVTWTHSVNGNLKNEKIFLDGVEKCDVLASNAATCNFVVTDLSGQQVTAQAFNSQNTGSAIYEMGSLLTIPEPPTGAVFTITHIP